MKVFLDNLNIRELFENGGHIITSKGNDYGCLRDFDENVKYSEYEGKILSAYIGDREYHYIPSTQEFIYCGSKTLNSLRKSDAYGIKNVNFTCVSINDSRWDRLKEQRMERGFDDSELWGLNHTIVKFILPRLKRFVEIDAGYPSDVEDAVKWREILNTIVDAFEDYLNGKLPYCEDYEKYIEERRKKLDNGFQLFFKYFDDLWY